MTIEEIATIEIAESNELYVILASGGNSSYQHIYREAAEVDWDNDKKAFKSPPPRQWSHADWYHHIASVAASGLGVSLRITNSTRWVNIPDDTKEAICAK